MSETLFVGGLFPKEKICEIKNKSKGPIQFAANNLQWNIINGLEENLNEPVQIVNQMFLGSFPKKYTDFYVNSFKFSHNGFDGDYNVGYLNLMYVKQLFLFPTLKRHLKKTLKNNKDINSIIFYSAQSYFFKNAKWIKRRYPNIHIHFVLPDMPIYMSLQNSSTIMNLIRGRNNKLLLDSSKYVDSYTFLTKYMAEYLNVPNDRYCVVEGISSNSSIYNKEKTEDNNDLITITYTGTLTKKYGVLDLVSAFKNIKYDNYRLIICGDGETKKEIEQASKEDKRIIYKGLVSSDEAKEIQAKSTLLVNPRKNDFEYTKYSFPSKILEYLSSGKPVLCYKLDGMPDEYDKFIYYIEGNSIEDFTSSILKVCMQTKEELTTFSNNAKLFVEKNKNAKTQCRKIVSLVKGEICGEDNKY